MTQSGPFQHVSAGGMSLLVHGLFVAFLLFGVSWRSLPHLPVEAELWSALPEPPAPLPEPPAPLPELPPAPLPTPVPPAKVAKPEVKPEVAKPDIALERAEKKRREQEVREQEALQRKEAARLAELQRQAEEKERIEKEKAAQAEKFRQERRAQARREMELQLARQAQEELDAEETQLRGALQKQQAKASRQAHLVDEFQDRIRSKILAYSRLPHNLTGNPEVVFNVTLLPNGEVVRAVLVRSSGQPAYDQEMERAILKASPLPLPKERDVAEVFRDGLILKFRPYEDAAGGR